ncbi:hypothetical protein DOFOFD_03705 [Acetobacteraceae bacterium EV16P]|uniref:Uncharacterized protein n=1 Tax=Sorlinia euscelidii TaxID=3081148 RepID=A0ABU7U0W9_9PROT
MRCIKDAEFQIFIGDDVVDQLCADCFETGATRRESILHHPLGEGLGDQRQIVLQAARLIEALLRCIIHAGGDAVHHRIGKRHMLGNPTGEASIPRFGKTQNSFAGDITIMTQIVTGEHCETFSARIPAAGQPFNNIAEEASGMVRIREVLPDRGRIKPEKPGHLINMIATLRDGHGYDACRGCREGGQHFIRLLRCVQIGAHGANNPTGFRAVRSGFRQAVEALLCVEAACFPGPAAPGVSPTPIMPHSYAPVLPMTSST